MATDLPINDRTLFLRYVFDEEVSVFDGKVSPTAFEPRVEADSTGEPRVEIDSTAFKPKAKDKGLLSTEHGDRPGSAQAFLGECKLSSVAGVWAVEAADCTENALPWVNDGGEGELSDWHISIDFRAHLPKESENVNSAGKKKARKLRDRAVARGQQA